MMRKLCFILFFEYGFNGEVLGFSKVNKFGVEHGNFGLLLLKETIEWLQAFIRKW